MFLLSADHRTGNDSIIDHWNTFGIGSVLQKANLIAQLYGYSTGLLLSRSLKLATGNILPLDDKGVQQWDQSRRRGRCRTDRRQLPGRSCSQDISRKITD